LVKHLVELHGGRVEARSEGAGRGTEMTVYLPAQLKTQGALPAAATVSPAAPERSGTAPRVLVVDDLEASAETLMMLLEMEGCEVKIANEGKSALEIAETFRPGVVLLDIGLPGMNGFEVARGLRNLPASRDALLIALTGYGEAESRERSAQAGFDFHMVKPADLDLLLSMINNPAQARRPKPA
jgi:CheY-like chemotaxis protein